MTVNPNHHSSYAPADLRPALWERWVALRNGDLAYAEDIVAPALGLHVPALGVEVGRAAGRAVLLSWISAQRAASGGGDIVVQVGPIIADDLIAGRWAVTSRGSGGHTVTGTDILRVDAGQVVELWVNHDLFGAAVPAGQAAA